MLTAPLLRSVLRATDSDDEAVLVANLHRLSDEIQDIDGVDKEIVLFLADLLDRAKTVPTLKLAIEHYTTLQSNGNGSGLVGLVRLEPLQAPLTPALISGAEFTFALDAYFTQRLKDQLARILMEGAQILQVGVEAERIVKGKKEKVRLQGPEDALLFAMEHLGALRSRKDRGRLEGSFFTDAPAAVAEYARIKANPKSALGVLTGVKGIDDRHHGIKRGELALVMGFPSHMKSTFCLNWAYRAAVWYGHNVGYVPLEMSVAKLRTLFLIMHSSHDRFKNQLTSIDHDKVMAGVLSEEEEQLYAEVADDLATNPTYGQIFYLEPSNTISMAQVQQWAEKHHARTPLELLVIDYLGLMEPGLGVSTPDPHHRLNAVIRQAKLCAMTFGHGRGLSIVSPFQANREGLKDADKNGGHYKLTALAGANEAEKSSDLVYYTYLDDQRRTRSVLAFGNLKNRDGKMFTEQLELSARASTRVICDIKQSTRDDELKDEPPL